LIGYRAKLKAAGVDTELIFNGRVDARLIGDCHSAIGMWHYENAIHPK
jgi:hypothetical protein